MQPDPCFHIADDIIYHTLYVDENKDMRPNIQINSRRNRSSLQLIYDSLRAFVRPDVFIFLGSSVR